MLTEVKKMLGITGTYLDDLLTGYINEVKDFLIKSGVLESSITAGVVARGVSDLWNYGAGEGTFSEAFLQRATQLALYK